ncbi:endo alpha-1,4 polygalactosaminidase [Thermus thermamylovorans]|uniref:endo alpha-1,4 polygalactosaminidase n=1 Tax=Thermus thermamylovorans TaxID=2509362 RepID=UPI001F310829|nr:endo alpha-1,4 polygalactosaminidase [Thermus thermamylovorans]
MPTSLTVQQGQQGTLTLTLTPQGGFDGQVTLSLVGAPTGVSLSPDSLQVTGANPVIQNLAVSVAPSVDPGSYPLSLRVQGGGIAKAASFRLSVVSSSPSPSGVRTWVYQLTGYPPSGLAQLGSTAADLVVIDLTKDGRVPWSPQDLQALRGKRALAYLEVGGMENYRAEYLLVQQQASDLLLNTVPGWPGEWYVKYWDERWWDLVVAPRLDKALAAGFQGVYLDLVDAYEGISLSLVPGETRDTLAQRMVALLQRISAYVKARRPDFWVFPQNAPELRAWPGYLAAVDGVGLEELFFYATDRACTDPGCAVRLRHARAIREAGKLVLTVDYALDPRNVRTACQKAREEGFVPYVTVVELDRISPLCP